MNQNKKLLFIYVYQLPWGSGGEVANDFWKYRPIAMSKKNKVVFFSFAEEAITKKFFIKNIFGIFKNYFFSKLVVFRPININFIQKIQFNLLVYFLGFNKRIVVVSSLPDQRIFGLCSKWLKPLFVYDCTDQICDMNDKKNDFFVKKEEEKFIKKCDLTFVNSSVLFDIKKNFSPKVREVPAGFPSTKYFKLNLKHKENKNKTIVCIGAVCFRLDFDLLIHVIGSNPECNFIFIGPYLNLDIDWMKKMDKVYKTKENWEKIKKFPNFKYLGYMKREKINKISSGFDIGIIPYNISQEFNLYCNPVKFYDYLAMGKPVITTDMVELRKYKNFSHVKIAKDKYYFDNFLKEYKIRKGDIKKGRIIARNNSPENKVKKMIFEIKKYANA